MTAWLSQFFIHPAFVLPGLGLVALPVIIHLINRMRYRRVRFAAMEFLLQSQQKNRRKLFLEQLLLLLLRMAAVALLVALIARPFFDPSQLLILQGEKAHHVVLIDDSGSMDDRWAETSAFDSALEAVRKIAQQGARQAGTQNLTLMLLSQPDQPLLNQAGLDPTLINELETKLENLKCTHRGLDLVQGLQLAGQQLQIPAAAKYLHVVGDFRSRDWGNESAVAQTLKDLAKQGIDINLVRAVPERHPNLGVLELVSTVNVSAANVPVRLRTRVRNFGDQVAQGVRLSVLQDGQKLPISVVIDQLEADAEVTREFDIVFDKPGKHDVHVTLPPDSLAADNSRYLAVNIAQSNPVLIIAGNLSDGEALYLQDALAPAAGLTGFAPVIDNVEFLRRQPLQSYGSIYMLDVPEIPADALRALEQYVQGGGGLVWFVGPQVRPAFYTEKLYKEGQGIFPAPLGVTDELTVDATNPVPDFNFEDHPVFRAFQGQDNPFVEGVRVNQYFRTPPQWQAPANVRVIARLKNKQPIFLESKFGLGKVIACLTTCGVRWNDWPRNPSYVLLQLELQQYIARTLGEDSQRLVGEPIEIALDPATYRSQLEIRPPDVASTIRMTAVAPKAPEAAPGQATPAETRLVETFRNTNDPGIYTVIRYRQDETTDPLLLAYNVPTTESELTIAPTDEMRRRLGTDTRVRIQEYGDFSWIQGRQAGQEVRDLILLVILCVLVGEQLLALRMSYHARGNSAAPLPKAERPRGPLASTAPREPTPRPAAAQTAN